MPVMRENRFEMILPPALLARLDEWREQQPVSPTRAAAIRQMVADWLDGQNPQKHAPNSR